MDVTKTKAFQRVLAQAIGKIDEKFDAIMKELNENTEACLEAYPEQLTIITRFYTEYSLEEYFGFLLPVDDETDEYMEQVMEITYKLDDLAWKYFKNKLAATIIEKEKRIEELQEELKRLKKVNAYQ